MLKRSSLKRTLLSNFLLISILPFLVVLAVALIYFSGYLNDDVKDDQLGMLNILSIEAEKIIKEPIVILAEMDDMYQYTIESDQQMTAYIDTVLSHYTLFESIKVIDENGTVVIAPSDEQGTLGFDLSNQEYYQGETDDIYWSKVFTSTKTSNPTIAVVKKGHGDYSLLAYYSLYELQKLISQVEVADNNIYAIVDSNGQYIAHTNYNFVAERNYDKHFSPEVLMDEQVIDYEGTRYIVRRDKLEGLDFYLSIRTPYYSHYVNIINLMLFGLSVIVVISIVIGYLSNYQAKALLKPITDLTEEINKIASGKYGEVIEPASFEEINKLIEYFNNMSQTIQENFLLLSDSRAELESLNQDLLVQNDEIAKSEIEIATILGNLYSGIILLSPELEILRVNQAVYRLLKIPSNRSSYHVNVMEFFEGVPEVCSKHSIDMVRFSKKKITSLVDVDDKLIEQTIMPLVNKRDNITGLIVSFKDITEQKNLEAQLNRSMKLEAIGRLSGGIAHDFNNILQIIIGYGELVELQLSKMTGTEKLVSQMNLLTDSAKKAEKLIKKLMVFSKMDTAIPGRLDVNKTVQEIETMLSGIIGDDIVLMTKLSPDLLSIYADQTQIEQTVMNLCVNAKDAMANGGDITIRTYNHERSHKKYVCIEIQDTGTGIPKHIQDKIFDPFFTTKDVGKGTGLGLATVLGIVEKNHGFVELDSEEYMGSTFRLYFPATINEQAKIITEEEGESTVSLSSYTVLLAEDDPSVRAIAKETITSVGGKVIEATDGQDAFNKFMANKDDIDILIFDVLMPKMNGVETYDAIKNTDPDIKVIFTTGYSNELLSNEYNLSVNGKILQKPYKRNALLTTLYEVIHM